MPEKINRPPDDPEQSKRFEEAARELQADETGKTFSKAFSEVTKRSGGTAKPSRTNDVVPPGKDRL